MEGGLGVAGWGSIFRGEGRRVERPNVAVQMVAREGRGEDNLAYLLSGNGGSTQGFIGH